MPVFGVYKTSTTWIWRQRRACLSSGYNPVSVCLEAFR